MGRDVVLKEQSDAKIISNGVSIIPMGRAPLMKIQNHTITVQHIRIDEPFPDSLYVFTSPEGMQQIATRAGLELDLTGQAAIDFRLKDLDGRDVSLSDFRGKVVLLI
jgi:hypothetical protein